ncbi:MAG: carboxylesterase family protein [Lachnospiraceae bacterium]|nr:carboxylesterase family protein [Lachnospiraceae bacterium]
MENRRVKIETGELQGVFGYDPRITVFKGVPYAAPPVGELRWKSPSPAKKWEGVRVADTYGPISCQHVPGLNPEDFWTRELHPAGPEYPMSEDCLYVNIFTPAKTGKEKLPVLFYIHGGGYQGGYPFEVEFDWEHMARKGIVVVAVTYRLGIMGFLTSTMLAEENPAALKGNYGIQDQLYALQWTRRNIAAFGGNPDKITIAGQSAGAGSVQCLLATPYAKDTMAGAILQSGVFPEFGDLPAPINPCTLEHALRMGDTLFEKAGITNLQEARNIPATELIRMEAEYMEPGIHFQPVVDGDFLPETTFEAMKRGHHHNVPILAGYNRGEVRAFRFGAYPENMEELKAFAERYGDKAEEFLKVCNVKTEEDIPEIFEGDAYLDFVAGTVMLGHLQYELGRDAYLYEFDADIPGDEDHSSFHGSELWFAYDSLARSWRPFEGKHYDLARQISSYWVNFVKNGNPNGEDVFGYRLPEWKRFTADNSFLLRFKDAPQQHTVKEDELMKFRIRFAREV